jgi:DNA-binding MarR family transcriptional regulator
MTKCIKVDSNHQHPNSKIDRLIHEPSRYTIMSVLYVTNNVDFLFLMHHTRFTGGNLSAHIKKLENSGYISIEKEFLHNKPHTMVYLTESGRLAFEQYRKNMKRAIDTLPHIKVTKSIGK